MPADYEILPDRALAGSRAGSRRDDADLLGHQDRLRADPGFRSGYHQLFDFRPVTRVAVSREAARRRALSPSDGARPHSRPPRPPTLRPRPGERGRPRSRPDRPPGPTDSRPAG